METDWRKFELLISDIEKMVSSENVIVTSPDRIPDKITGQPREVDASIKGKVGSNDILITIECRKRNDKQDVTWIEQLVTKKESVGANLTIAVSSTGFSDPAKKLAAMKGIKVRTFSDITEMEVVQEWLHGFKMFMVVTTYESQSITFMKVDGSYVEPNMLPDEFLKGENKEMLYMPIIEQTGKGIFPLDLLFRRVNTNRIPEDGKWHGCTIVANFQEYPSFLLTKNGKQQIIKIVIQAQFKIERKNMDNLRFKQYREGDNEPIMEVIEGSAPVDDKIEYHSRAFVKTGVWKSKESE